MNKPVVLFVDDDRYEMLGLTERLEASGFMVEPMFSSSSALDRLKRGLRPDLIISDLIMATSPDEVGKCVQVLEGSDGVAAVELGLSDQATHRDAQLMVSAARENTHLPILATISALSSRAWSCRMRASMRPWSSLAAW